MPVQHQSHRSHKNVIQRRVRNRQAIPSGEVKLPKPKPVQEHQGSFSWFSVVPTLGMSLVMGVILWLTTKNIPITIIPMLFMGGLSGYSQLRQAKQRNREIEEKNNRNSTLFFNDLNLVKRQLENAAQRQFKISIKENPSLPKLVNRVKMRQSSLWERQVSDNDFISIRLGIGKQPLCVDIDFLDPDHEQPLIEKANKLAKNYEQVDDLPIMASLGQLGSIGLKGQQLSELYMAFGVVINLTTHHSPDEVHLYVVSHRSDAIRRWEWVKWLPHTNAVSGSDDSEPPRLSFTPSTDEDLILPLNREIKRRNELQQKNSFVMSNGPHIVLILDKASRLKSHPMIEMIVAQSPDNDDYKLGASVIFVDEPIHPRVSAIAEVRGSQFIYREVWGSGANKVDLKGKADLAMPNLLEPFSRAMAPLRTAESYAAGGAGLPSSVRLVEILGAQQADRISLEHLYEDKYQARKIMSFPVGINTDGKPQLIHLREKGQKGNGQHAILAGGTGGGKSITLQTIVLSLAANHPPKHLNIILADFKAGASELSKLKGLPHVVGFVTDLKPSYVERFRQALEGEITWRKRLFERSVETLGQQVTNIYDYNELAQEEPLPHLVLVIDEFHKAQQLNESFQETIDNGVAAQGRALGMHLILSTQKADDFGSVLPNIEVKMSMRMNRSEDSKAIFKRDEAFTMLKRPGQAFLQASANDMEIFEMFQVARADTDFVADAEKIVETTDKFKISRFLPDGSREVLFKFPAEEAAETAKPDEKSKQTDADVIVAKIEQYCNGQYGQAKDICLEPLASGNAYPLYSLLDHTPLYRQWEMENGWGDVLHQNNYLRSVCGMVDLPFDQQQVKFFVDLNKGDGNLLVIGPQGAGKSLFLRSLLIGLMATHRPDEFQFYVVGRGSDMGILEDFPHCGGVIRSSVERERVTRLLDFLDEEIKHRNQLLIDYRVDNFDHLRKSVDLEPIPAIVVVIESIGTFRDEYESKLTQLQNLVADGKNADIHFILTNTSMQGIHSRIQENVQQRIGLGLKSRADYIEVLDRRAEPVDDITGRGYVIYGEAAVEFQSASPYITASDLNQSDYLSAIAEQMTVQKPDREPQRIETLGKHISLMDIWEVSSTQTTGDGSSAYLTAPIGMEFDRLEPVSLDLERMDPVLFITGPGQSGKTNALISIVLSAARAIDPHDLKIVVFATGRSPMVELQRVPHMTLIDQSGKEISMLVDSKDKGLLMLQNVSGLLATKPLQKVLFVIDDAQFFFRGDSELMNMMTQMMAMYEEQCRVLLAEVPVNLTQLKNADYKGFVKWNLDFGSGLVFSAEESDMNMLAGFGAKINVNTRRLHKQKIGSGRGFLSYANKMQVVQIGTIFDVKQQNQLDKKIVREVVSDIVDQYQKQLPGD